MKSVVNAILLLTGVAVVITGWVLFFDSLPISAGSAKAVLLSIILISVGTLFIHPHTRSVVVMFVLYSHQLIP